MALLFCLRSQKKAGRPETPGFFFCLGICSHQWIENRPHLHRRTAIATPGYDLFLRQVLPDHPWHTQEYDLRRQEDAVAQGPVRMDSPKH